MARVDSVQLVVRSDAARVFAALIDREALEQWLPPTGMSGRFDHFDARPGGSYRLVLSYEDAAEGHGKTTSDSDVADVRFVEIQPDTRLVQAVDFVSDDPSFVGTMTLTWDLRPAGEATLVEIRAENVPVGISPEDHAVGMASSLSNLAAFVEALEE
jgi:uncharacterized protein YndB with AHSA1/START domain